MIGKSRSATLAAIACAVILGGCVEERYNGQDWNAPIYERDDPRNYEYDPRDPGYYDPRPDYPDYEPRYPREEPRDYRPRYPREPRGDYRPRYPRETRGDDRPRSSREEPRPSRPREEPRSPRPADPEPPRQPQPPRAQPVDCRATPNAPPCIRYRRTGTGGTDNPAGPLVEQPRGSWVEERP